MYSHHEPYGADGGCGDRRGRRSGPQDAQDARPNGGRSEPRQSFKEHGEALAGSRPTVRRKSFLVCKDGHVFTFVYPPEHELVALKALADCPNLDPAEVLALVCYLGHDPRELGEELF